MKEFETSVKKAEGLSKALKTSMSDLGSLSVDPSGKLKRTLDDYSVGTTTATQSTREFFREQQMQDRIFKESVQSITGAVFALSLFTQGNEKADATTKKVTQSLLAGVGAANAAEFGFFGLGKSLSNLPGMVGRFGAALSGLGGPIGLALGVGAMLITFFQQTNEEAKKAADEGLKDYTKAIEDAASAMDDFLPEVDAAREKSLRESLNRTEGQLKFFRSVQSQTVVEGKLSKLTRLAVSAIPFGGINVPAPGTNKRRMTEGGVPEFLITPEEAASLGIDPVELGAMTPAMLKERIDSLTQMRTTISAQLRVIRGTVTKPKPALRPEDLKKGKLPGPPQLYGPEKPSYIDQEYEQGKRLFEAFTERRERMEEKLAELQQSLNERVAAAREASWQRDMAAVQNLGNVLASTFNVAGESFVGKMLRALQIAIEIAKALRFAKSAEGEGLPGVLGIISAIVPGIGLFLNKGQLPASASDSVNSAYAGGSSGSSNTMRVSGSVDLSNGKLFLIQEMPAYNTHLASKTV